jgi:putative flippase GtrA
MADKDTALAVLQSAIALAGLLLVFSGFIFSRADAFQDSRRANRYRTLAKMCIIPVLAALGCSFLSLLALEGVAWAGLHLILSFKILIGITSVYSVMGMAVS